MPKDTTPGKPTTRRYSPEEKAAAVRMVRTLRAELGTEHGTVQRVASQLGYGTESGRSPANTSAVRNLGARARRSRPSTGRPADGVTDSGTSCGPTTPTMHRSRCCTGKARRW